jgi:hypothetical protein
MGGRKLRSDRNFGVTKEKKYAFIMVKAFSADKRKA